MSSLRGLKIVVECVDDHGLSWMATVEGSDALGGGGSTPLEAVDKLQQWLMVDGLKSRGEPSNLPTE